MLNTLSFSGLAAGQRAVHLRVIETTDLHLHLLPYDYYADRPSAGVGLSEAARLIDEARTEAGNSVVFDNGDFLQGTPMGDYVAHQTGLRDGDVHPIMAAMNAVGYDAITLGNHEFNYGLDFLMATLDGANFPVVSANLAVGLGSEPRKDTTLVKPYVLLDRMLKDQTGFEHPIRIGVVGFAPPQVMDWDNHALDGRLHARDIVEAARAWVPEMREAGADLVIALAHTGIGSARYSHGMENAAIPLARVPGIDALLTGHSHLLFPSPVFGSLPDVDIATGTIAGKPAVMAGCWGAHIGVIDMLLVHEAGEWQVLGTRSEVRALPTVQEIEHADPAAPRDNGPSERVVEAVAQAHADTLTSIRRPVGTSSEALHSYFTHLGVTGSLQVVAEAQRDYVRARITDPDLVDLPILSAVAPFKSGGRGGPAGYTDVPAGPVALRHIADLYPFPNAIAALCLTGAEVIEWLERSAAAFNRIRPGSTGTPLRNGDVPGYNFEVIDPLDVIYDLSQPARYDFAGVMINEQAHRVISVMLDGEPLDPQGRYLLCTNSYRAGGAGKFAGAKASNLVLSDESVTRDILHRHVREHGSLRRPDHGSLRFKAMPNTSVIFETGPAAMAHMNEIEGFHPEQRGLTPHGFLRLKLDLSHGA
ncbi:bifunctional 2',3'-cyclic-nucleotide 2'-phosphodiesterase/3'-nucleotidase [Pararhodobacter zhoushanensis]|uniref:bifunctional 2',3'-cyclic-nucleotide 2'-phosphodiesterase/3'-nucleotidase n=1 Tax=Pararhodobacter zhoushanensis TaxID=2479545 RepID=UPI0013E0218B|nr:bifunctional 2',3'-cyclic-nucleotide 2'-phosphodiesterase/3'-nucleotidase [Pararhodobacter zhoushanensis]